MQSIQQSNQELENMEIQCKVDEPIDPANSRFPYCIVWTALPCLTCCVPCVGHTGICTSDGVIYDFVGMGPMHSGELAFGAALKYYQLDHSQYSRQQWDNAIRQANQKFCLTNHNLITNNCHHHVAEVLNILKYQDRENWGQVDIALLALRGKHTGIFAYWIYVVFVLIALFVLW